MAEQLNCQFFVVSQCNPHLVNLGFDADGAPGRPCRWLPRRGGHLLAGIELYLRLDMILKMDFLKQVGAVTNWTAELMTQTTEGDTTIVPQVKLIDYLKVGGAPLRGRGCLAHALTASLTRPSPRALRALATSPRRLWRIPPWTTC